VLAYDNTRKLLLSITDSDGRVTGFDYDPSKPLVSLITNPSNCQTHYEYNSNGLLIGITDPQGHRTGYEYDMERRVTKRFVPGQIPGEPTIDTLYRYEPGQTVITDALGGETIIRLDGNLLPVSVKDAAQQETLIERNAFGEETKRTDATGAFSRTAYNEAGRVITTTDALGHPTSYAHDDYGNVTRITYPDGTWEDLVWGFPESTFDTTGAKRRLQKRINFLGHTTQYFYNQRGQVIQEIDAENHNTFYSYNPQGQLTSNINGRGFATAFGYDAYGNMNLKTDARDHVWSYIHDVRGRVRTVTDPDLKETTTVYDEAGNLTLQIDAVGRQTETEYTIFGQPKSQTVTMNGVIEQQMSWEYDNLGRETAFVDARGKRSTTEYWPDGQVKATVDANHNRTDYRYDPISRTSTVTNALQETNVAESDAAGRVIATVDGRGKRSVTEYDPQGMGRVVATMDANGKRTRYEYDRIGRQEAVVDANEHRTSFGYDRLGRRTDVTDARGGHTHFVLDANSNLEESHDPLGAVTCFVYDREDNQVQRTDAIGRITTYYYDLLNRLDGEQHSDSSTVSYRYNALGQMEQMQDASGATVYVYGKLGLVESVSYPTGKSLSYSYDAAGNRILLVDPDQGHTVYDHDDAGRLKSIQNPFREVTSFEYDALDREKIKTLGNGVVAEHFYDAAGREEKLEYRRSDGTPLARYESTYDEVGNRLSTTELDGSIVTYGYDDTYQLTGEARTGNHAYSTSYQYDPAGNRTHKTEHTSQGDLTTVSDYNAANQLKQAQVPDGQITLFSYDLNGNLTQESSGDAATQYFWDDENRLVQVLAPDGTNESYFYSPDGRRQKKLTVTGTTHFVWDGENLLQETDGTLKTISHYTDRPGIWGGLSSERRLTESRFYIFDQQDNTRLLLNQGQSVDSSYIYTAFGERVYMDGSSYAVFLFGGRVGYYHDDSYRIYIRARHLDIKIGRWMSYDPVGFEVGDGDLYLYTSNNPIFANDPTGLRWSEGYDAVYNNRREIWNVAGAYDVPVMLLAAVVYSEVGANDKPFGTYALFNQASIVKFADGVTASIGITQKKLDPMKIPSCRIHGIWIPKLAEIWAIAYDNNTTEQLRAGARLLKRLINQRPMPKDGLSPHDMAIILTEYNGVKPGKSGKNPYQKAQPGANGRNFYRNYMNIADAISGVPRSW